MSCLTETNVLPILNQSNPNCSKHNNLLSLFSLSKIQFCKQTRIPIIFLDFKIGNSAWSVADTLNRDSILFRKIHENGFFSNPESICKTFFRLWMTVSEEIFQNPLKKCYLILLIIFRFLLFNYYNIQVSKTLEKTYPTMTQIK